MAETKEAVLIAHVERRLTSKYSQVPSEEVSTIVQGVVARFVHSPIRDFVSACRERMPVRDWPSWGVWLSLK